VGMFASDEIIPDVVDSEPQQTLMVKYTVGDDQYSLDKYGQELTPTQVQNQPVLSVASGVSTDKQYTVILTDPDAADREKHEYREWVHLVVVNVPVVKQEDDSFLFDTASGETVIEYIGSAPPPETGLHRYTFLVYEQTKAITVSECGQAKLIAKGGKGEGRPKWKARTFASNNGLDTLVAGNFYQAQYDDFVPKIYASLEPAAEEEEKKEARAKTNKILIILGDFVEDYEAMVPYQALSAAGYAVHTVCPEKKAGDKVKTSIHDFEGAQTYSEKKGHNFELNYDFAEAVANKATYDGLVIPGGRSTEYLSARQDVVSLVEYFTSNDLPIAAICHGPLLLGSVKGYLAGKKATSYGACKPVLELAGAEWQEPEPITTCFTDGRLVTGAAWPAHPQFCAQLMQVLGAKVSGNEEKAKRVLIVAGDFVEDYEMMCVFQMLQAFGVEVDVVCPDKAKGDKIKTCVHDFEGDQTYTEKPGHLFELNASFDEVQPAEYDGLYIPGGRCSEYLSVNKRVVEIVQEFAGAKKVIAQICHGVLVLAAAKVLQGRDTTAYPACAPVVELCGANYLEPEPITKGFTDKKDGEYTLVSGGAWPAHSEFVAMFIKELGVTVEI